MYVGTLFPHVCDDTIVTFSYIIVSIILFSLPRRFRSGFVSLPPTSPLSHTTHNAPARVLTTNTGRLAALARDQKKPPLKTQGPNGRAEEENARATN